MAITKYADSEGKMEVLSGRSAEIVNEHLQRNSKTRVSDFDPQQKALLEKDLEAVIQKEV